MKINTYSLYFTFFLIIYFAVNSFSQRWCATQTPMSYYTYAQQRSQIIKSQLLANPYESLPCINKSLSIAVHIVKDSLGETNFVNQDLVDELDIANETFKPICLDFNICTIDSIDNFQYDSLYIDDENFNAEELQMVNLFDVDSVINIYLITAVEVRYTFASSLQRNNHIILRKDNLNELSHQLGHFFGLIHTSGSGLADELVNASNCETSGDFICETEADPSPDNYSGGPYSLDTHCELSLQLKDSNNEYYMIPSDNYMSLYIPCRCIFTPMQYRIMVMEYYLNHTNLR